MPRHAIAMVVTVSATVVLSTTALGAASARPKPGHYAGTTSERTSVTFRVSDHGARVTGFTTVDGYNNTCHYTGAPPHIFHYTVKVPLMKVRRGGLFSATVKATEGPFTGTFRVQGRFSSGKARGTVTRVGRGSPFTCGSAASNPNTPIYRETFAAKRPAAVNGRIAWKSFPRSEHDTWSIYAANQDGSGRRRLTHPAVGLRDDYPDWSPDGSKIVFLRTFQPDSNSPTIADEIMRVNADGSGLRQIGTCKGRCVANGEPQYSPTGHQIVFSRLMHAGASKTLVLGVWVMDADGSNPHQITQLSTAPTSEDHEPAWSPDGKKIVFMRLNTAVPANQQALFIVASSGGTPHRITPWKLNAGGANWSPNGSKILFQSYRDCTCSQTSQAYTIAPDGSRLHRLTNAGRNIEPNWSPNGKKIVYAHQPGVGLNGLPDLWVMNANGKNKRPVIKTKGWESEPDWGTAPPTS